MYFTPTITETGMHIPTYIDIRDALVADAKTIFGQDIYLGDDSQDYQFISVISAKIYDSFQIAQMVYNNRSPVSALGTALDGLVKLNGIKRKPAVYSTCLVTIAGTPGVVISNGVVMDVNKINWSLPATVTIPEGGTIEVSATCQQNGSIVANIGEITSIVTPLYGWTSVNNLSAATVGTPVETDSQLRSRQAVNTAAPSLTQLETTVGAIAGVSNVTRYLLFENDDKYDNSLGHPPHSITAIVEGGTDADVADALANNKGIGCYTNGTTSVVVSDSYNQDNTIRFYRPSYVDIDVVINIKSLAGYTSQVTDLIKTGIVDYLNSLQIYSSVSISSLWGAALLVMTNLFKPIFSITSLTAARHSGVQGTTDIDMLFNEVARGNTAYITVNVT